MGWSGMEGIDGANFHGLLSGHRKARSGKVGTSSITLLVKIVFGPDERPVFLFAVTSRTGKCMVSIIL